MLRNAFHALAYWTPALIICLAVVARAAAPFPYHEADYAQPVIESLVAVTKQRSDKDTLYIKVDGGDPSAAILTELNSRKLPPTFAPWSTRSPKEDHCRALGGPPSGISCRSERPAASRLARFVPLLSVS
jgi:hypothetical protein